MSNRTVSPTISEENFQLVWHNYQSNFHEVVADLLGSEAFADVSLVAEGRVIRAHRLVLSACSPYLHGILRSMPPGSMIHPVLFMSQDISLNTLRLLVEFMYHGIVHVPHTALMGVLHAGDILQIRGLCRTDYNPSEEGSTIQTPPPSTQNNRNRVSSEERATDSIVNAGNVIDHCVKRAFENNDLLSAVKQEPYDWSTEQHNSENESMMMVDDTSMLRPTVLLTTKTDAPVINTENIRMSDDSGDEDEEPTPLRCEQCNEVFPRAGAWVRHLKIHPPLPISPSSVQAPITTTTSSSSSSTTTDIISGGHKKKPTPSPSPQQQIYDAIAALRRPHICNHCGKKFSSRASLSIHGRTHTGETPFICDFCNKGFNVKSNLLRHLRTLHNRIMSPAEVDN